MSELLERLKDLFRKSSPKRSVDINVLKGAFLGAAIGESIGMPVKNKTIEELTVNPVSDFLGFGDMSLPAGSIDVCTESLLDFAKYLVDNVTPDISVSRFFSLVNNWYIIKVMDEPQRLRIMIPCACLSGVYYSCMKPNLYKAAEAVPDIVCDEAVVSSTFVFYVSYYISLGENPRSAIGKAHIKTNMVLKKIGIIVLPNSFYENLFNILNTCYSNSFDFKTNILYCVNKGFYPDLIGNVCGFFSGLFCGVENIPYIWSEILLQRDVLQSSAESTIEKMGALAQNLV